jgi:hypothetical protein
MCGLTKEHPIEQEFMSPPLVVLEDGHMCCCAEHVQEHENCRDRNIDLLLRYASESPGGGPIWA